MMQSVSECRKQSGFRQQSPVGKWRTFWHKDQQGATAVEFALIAAPLFACIFFMLQAGFVMLASETMRHGVREAGRRIRVGLVQAENMSESDFREFICGYVTIPNNQCMNDLMIDVRSAPTIKDLSNDQPTDANGNLDESKTQYDAGKSAEYVIVTAYLPMDSFAGIIELVGGTTSGRTILSSTTVFRNEPFGNQSSNSSSSAGE